MQVQRNWFYKRTVYQHHVGAIYQQLSRRVHDARHASDGDETRRTLKALHTIREEKERPASSVAVQMAVQEAMESVAILTCGQDMLADDVRAAVVEQLEAGRGRIVLFHEGFSN